MTSKTVETILAHMNKDHKISLYDYLAHFAGIKLDLDNPRQSVELVDVKLDKLALNYNENGTLKSTIIPLQPPMKDLGESRVRLVKMAYKAADALKVSPYRIDSFIPINSQFRKIECVVLTVLVGFMAGAKLNPGFAARVAQWSPRIVKLATSLFYPTILVHFIEYFFFVLPILKYHRAPSRLYVIYFLLNTVVGYPSWLPLKLRSQELSRQRASFERNK